MNDIPTSTPFGITPDGVPIQLFTLRNRNGMEARITNYGGIVVSLTAPDRNGTFSDVVWGYPSLEGYFANSPYFGALIGRFGNRIANARFALENQVIQLQANNSPNHLHGGRIGFDKCVWAPEPHVTAEGPALGLRYRSPDGEEGYPGTLDVHAIYTLTHDNMLQFEVSAVTDKTTVVNITHHSYFNLAGQGDALDHQVQIHASHFTPIDITLIPTGEIRPVKGTPFDFRKPHAVGARIDAPDEQLVLGGGYDHNWVVDDHDGSLKEQACVTEPRSGRVMKVYSTAPGVQFYSGNFLDGTDIGKDGTAYQKRTALCFEPQHFPDSPNQTGFPSTVLRPAETYRHVLAYAFGTI